jgi:hypothetical protein
MFRSAYVSFSIAANASSTASSAKTVDYHASLLSGVTLRYLELIPIGLEEQSYDKKKDYLLERITAPAGVVPTIRVELELSEFLKLQSSGFGGS